MPMSPRLLRPLASGVHPEAAAWRSAVVANGGSVSASTLKAVSTFCTAIDAAGIRDRFYRLNLFCGTGLNAALVPLYRGPSRTGTQYGNTTDTNNGPFVAGDYAETGASGGLIGNATSKYLDTGFDADVLTKSDRHLGVRFDSTTLPSGRFFLGADTFGCGSNAYWAIGANNTSQASFRCANTFTGGLVSVSGKTDLLVSGNGSASSYKNGSADTTLSLTAFNAPSQSVFVFALNRCDSPADYSSVRLTMYSIGAAFTSGQAASFSTALAAFNTALSRHA